MNGAAETLHSPVLEWYAEHARDLPWRGAGATPWRVMVSEFMLQQTPVSRVLPVFEAWLETWPTPAALAAAPSGEAVRAWGRLGYPRRALRLHAAAATIVDEHGGEVPSAYEDLRALPGIGEYTASAIASFGFGGRHAVLDTNVGGCSPGRWTGSSSRRRTSRRASGRWRSPWCLMTAATSTRPPGRWP